MRYEIGPEESVSQAVTTTVIMLEQTCIDDLPALHEVLNPEALDVLFEEMWFGRVSFAYSNSFIDVYNGEYLIAEIG